MEEKRKTPFFSSPWLWCATTNYSEGFPYGMIRSLPSFYFRTMGVSLPNIGLSSLLGLPWTIKFLWGPQVDAYGTKRNWLVSLDGILATFFTAAAFFSLSHQGPTWIGILFFIAAFAAATHDIAIDGFYMASLDKEGQAKFIGYRTMAFRLAWMTTTGVITRIGTKKGWFWAFLAAGAIMLLIFIYHFLFLPEREKPVRLFSSLRKKVLTSSALRYLALIIFTLILLFVIFPKQLPAGRLLEIFKWDYFPLTVALTLLAALIAAAFFRNRILDRLAQRPDSFYARAFLTFMDQAKIGPLLAFIILVRAGEWLQSNMTPAFMVDLGLKIQYSWISAAFGLPATIVGALIGGWLISRYGIKKTIWPLLGLQNGANIVYMFLALGLNHYIQLNTGTANPVAIPAGTLLLVVLVHAFEQLASGMGNAILTMVLIRTCKPEFKAAHYAIGSGLMGIIGIVAGLFSGVLAKQLGYGLFFGVTFLVSLPGMALIFFIPKD